MSFTCYESYKDSGVEWLGELPAEWGASRIKHNTYLKGRVGWKGLTSDEFLVTGFAYLVTGTDFKGKFIEWPGCYQVEKLRYEDDPFIQLRNGDLLITKDGTIGKLAIVSALDKPACLNSGIFLVRPEHSYLSEYLYWVLLSQSFSLFCDLTTYGSTILHLYQNVFENFAFPLPPLSEQRTIATFLDQETGKIDALVAEQDKLIKLLKEKRQAVISHAVTKGLDPNAKMKDSGVEWLGEVPEGWGVQKISSLTTKITNGYVGPTRDILVDGGVRYLQSLHIKKNKIVFDSPYFVTDEWSKDHQKSILEEGDVLVVQTGDIGQAAVVTSEFTGCNCHALIILAPVRSNVIGQWISWVLNSDYGFHSLQSIQTGALHPHLNCGNVKGIAVPVPPKETQKAIVRFIEDENVKFDNLIEEAQKAIKLMKERRTALISAAVTGKIDVRGYNVARIEAQEAV